MNALRACAVILASALTAAAAVPAQAGASTYRMGPTTLRDCDGRDAADPVNVGFVGTHASWQNSQRLVGKDGGGPDLRWRTTRRAAGGTQSIMNGTVCRAMDAQSARGTGVRHSEAHAKRHTRFFEQLLAYTLNDDLTTRSLVTVQDAHRDVKRSRCRGPGSLSRLNDAVPRDIDGFEGGGYDSAQRLFLGAFGHRLSRYRHGPARMRFVQCGGEAPGTRYSVGWNGVIPMFRVDDHVPCQDDWGRPIAPDLGDCPTARGNEGTAK